MSSQNYIANKKIVFLALGCKVNTYENDALAAIFLNEGAIIANQKDKDVDIAIINTCSVTQKADQKSRQHIRKLKTLYPNAVIVVMGCHSQHSGKEIIERGEADIVFGVSDRTKIIDAINKLYETGEKTLFLKSHDYIRNNINYEDFNSLPLISHTRAYVKISDGCDNFCSYCIIPNTRGKLRSRNKIDILNEIKELINKGFKEIVLTGIHTGGYGNDLTNYKFSDLVEDILKENPSLYRLRISSIEATEIDDKLINILKKDYRLASHFHIPLQSGSKTVLERMHRKYDIEQYINIINKIRDAREDVSITTDLIVGFPLETEEEFQETISTINRIKYSFIHVFPFSSRSGTEASKLKDLDPQIKKERVNKIIELRNLLKLEYESKFYNKEIEVLFENYNKVYKTYRGHTSNYLEIQYQSNENLEGKIVKIKINNENIL